MSWKGERERHAMASRGIGTIKYKTVSMDGQLAELRMKEASLRTQKSKIRSLRMNLLDDLDDMKIDWSFIDRRIDNSGLPSYDFSEISSSTKNIDKYTEIEKDSIKSIIISNLKEYEDIIDSQLKLVGEENIRILKKAGRLN